MTELGRPNLDQGKVYKLGTFRELKGSLSNADVTPQVTAVPADELRRLGEVISAGTGGSPSSDEDFSKLFGGSRARRTFTSQSGASDQPAQADGEPVNPVQLLGQQLGETESLPRGTSAAHVIQTNLRTRKM